MQYHTYNTCVKWGDLQSIQKFKMFYRQVLIIFVHIYDRSRVAYQSSWLIIGSVILPVTARFTVFCHNHNCTYIALEIVWRFRYHNRFWGQEFKTWLDIWLITWHLKATCQTACFQSCVFSLYCFLLDSLHIVWLCDWFFQHTLGKLYLY